jgi:hypothetical protein
MSKSHFFAHYSHRLYFLTPASAGQTVDFRFEMSRISILALIRPAFSNDLKRLINSTQFPAHYGATNLINLARKSTHGISAISNHSIQLLSMKELISRPQSQKKRWAVRRAHV